MPGSLQLTVPVGVLPYSLARSFSLVSNFPMIYNTYPDGSVCIGLIEDGVNPPRPARAWQQSRRLTSADLTNLKNFWEFAVFGGWKSFYFYDPYDPTPGQPIGSNYDATGLSTQGRVAVTFLGDWQHTVALGRCDVPSLMLKEVV